MATQTTIDHSELRRLISGPPRGRGITGDAYSATGGGTVVYLPKVDHWLRIQPNGEVYFHSDASGGDYAALVGSGETTEEVFKVVRLFLKQFSVWHAATELKRVLDEDVPASVAHFAVEGAKRALRVLAEQAYDIDFFYGQD